MSIEKLSLLIVEESADIDDFADILQRFLRLSKESGGIILLPDFSRLRYKEQVLVLLLGFKAAKEVGFRDDESIGPKEVHDVTGINLSTAKGMLRSLQEERLVTSRRGKYTIPNSLLYLIRARLENLEVPEAQRNQKKHRRRSVSRDLGKIGPILDAAVDSTFDDFYNFLIEGKGDYLKKSLVILKIAKQKFQLDGLTAGEITYILKDHLRVPKIYQSNITTALGRRDASRFLFKEKNEAGRYAYKLNAKGEKLVEEIARGDEQIIQEDE